VPLFNEMPGGETGREDLRQLATGTNSRRPRKPCESVWTTIIVLGRQLKYCARICTNRQVAMHRSSNPFVLLTT